MLRFVKIEHWAQRCVVILFIFLLIFITSKKKENKTTEVKKQTKKMSKLQKNSHKTGETSSLCMKKGVPVGIKSVESQKPIEAAYGFKIG